MLFNFFHLILKNWSFFRCSFFSMKSESNLDINLFDFPGRIEFCRGTSRRDSVTRIVFFESIFFDLFAIRLCHEFISLQLALALNAHAYPKKNHRYKALVLDVNFCNLYNSKTIRRISPVAGETEQSARVIFFFRTSWLIFRGVCSLRYLIRILIPL